MMIEMAVEERAKISRAVLVKPLKRLAYVDSLRGVAILMVIVHHCTLAANLPREGFKGALRELLDRGDRGVQLFFLVSALTLFRSMDSRACRDPYPNLYFFRRRFFRIAPGFWLASLFYLWWAGWGPRAVEPRGISAWHVWMTSVFAHGWHPGAMNAIVPGGWSIGVEVSFCFLIPFLHRYFSTIGRLVAFLGCSLALAVLCGQIDLASRIDPTFCAKYPVPGRGFSFFWLPNQLPAFVLGLILSRLVSATGRRGDGSLAVDAPTLGWSIVGLAMMLFTSAIWGFPSAYGPYAVAFFLGTWGLSFAPTPLLVNRLTEKLGVISYGAYLTHFAAIDVAARLLGLDLPEFYAFRSPTCSQLFPQLFDAANWPASVRFVALLAITFPLTILASWLVRVLVELPSGRISKWATGGSG